MIRKLIRAIYLIVVLCAGVALLVVNVRLYLPAAAAYAAGGVPDDIPAQLAFLRQALDAGAGEEMQQFFPEGYYFSHVLYGLSWAQVGIRGEPYRDDALREARWALERLDTPTGRAAFSPLLDPPYGVFYVGWTNVLRGSLLRLDPDDALLRQQFEADTGALAAAFSAASTPFLTAYPGQAWPVDSVVAMAALALHDQLYPLRYQDVIARWLDGARQRLDPLTGLLPHRVDPFTGTGLETARGSSQSVILRFLHEIDPAWAAEQYRAFRRQFIGFLGTVPGIREYPPGINGEGDVDSGPLIGGLSASATVVTMGAAYTHNDRKLGDAFLHIGESAGLPLTWGGVKRYAFGLLPVGDAFLTWSQTAMPMNTAAGGAVGGAAYPDLVSAGWRLPLHLLSAGAVFLLLLPLVLRRPRRQQGE